MSKKLEYLLTSKLGEPDHDGDELNYECPRSNCGSLKKKLGVNLRRMKFHCWRCGWGGWLRELCEYLAIDMKDAAFAPAPVEAPTARPAIPDRIPGFHLIGSDPGSEIEKDILALCKRRGRLTADQVKLRGWGWSDDPYLFGRMVIPVRMHGQLVQYIGRAVHDYIEPKEKPGPIGMGWWSKTEIIYGTDTLRPGDTNVLVEGLWDYEAVRRTDYGVVDLMGTSLGDGALGAILSYRPSKLVLLFDGDDPGGLASVNIAQKIRERHFTEIYIARPPAGKDPDEVSALGLSKIIRDAVPYFSWLVANPRFKKSFKRRRCL